MVSQTITTAGAGTFIVPDTVISLTIEAWGAGASGGGGGTSNVNGGGGGGYSLAIVSVTAGQNIFYNVGTGGAGTFNPGVSGGDSWVNPSANSEPLSAPGVIGGGGVASDNVTPPSGGAGTIGTVNFTGGGAGTNAGGTGGGGGGGAGSAQNGATGVNGGAGGSGGTPDGGAGGAGAIIGPGNGGNGIQPGGGGGGSFSHSGGSGANGQIRFTWSLPDKSTTLTKAGKYFSRKDYKEWLAQIINENDDARREHERLIEEVETERNLTDTQRADRDFDSAESELSQSEDALFNNLTSTNHIKFSEAKERRDRARKDRDHHYYMDVVKKAWADFNEKKPK